MIRSFFNAHCCAVLEISKDTSDIRIILNGCEDQKILKVSRGGLVFIIYFGKISLHSKFSIFYQTRVVLFIEINDFHPFLLPYALPF